MHFYYSLTCCIAHQHICNTCRNSVHGSARIDTEMLVAISPHILYAIVQTLFNDADAHAAVLYIQIHLCLQEQILLYGLVEVNMDFLYGH